MFTTYVSVVGNVPPQHTKTEKKGPAMGEGKGAGDRGPELDGDVTLATRHTASIHPFVKFTVFWINITDT